MVNVCDRWDKDKTDDLQAAFFNGVGYETWENIWGIWNGITARDAEALRRIAKIERGSRTFWPARIGSRTLRLLQYGVFASQVARGPRTLWTIVNRNGVQRRRQATGSSGAARDALLRPVARRRVGPDTRRCALSSMEAHGFGAVLATGACRCEPHGVFERDATLRTAALLVSPKVWQFLPQQIAAIDPTSPASQAPEGMIKIRGRRVSLSRCRGSRSKATTMSAWTCSTRGKTRRASTTRTRMAIPAFYIDKYPVTNRQFKEFLKAIALPPGRRSQLPEGLEGRQLSRTAGTIAR